jgi:orotate phosphoribosyltransferase
VGVAFNRKELKDHGEGGLLVGAPVAGRVLMLDDVLTSGKAIREAAELVQSEGAEIAGAVIAMDRAEVMDGATSTAVAGLALELSAPVSSIAHVSDVLAYLQRSDKASASLNAMQVYVDRYCSV